MSVPTLGLGRPFHFSHWVGGHREVRTVNIYNKKSRYLESEGGGQGYFLRVWCVWWGLKCLAKFFLRAAF